MPAGDRPIPHHLESTDVVRQSHPVAGSPAGPRLLVGVLSLPLLLCAPTCRAKPDLAASFFATAALCLRWFYVRGINSGVLQLNGGAFFRAESLVLNGHRNGRSYWHVLNKTGGRQYSQKIPLPSAVVWDSLWLGDQPIIYCTRLLNVLFMTKSEHKLQSILEGVVNGKRVFGTSFAIKRGTFSWAGAAGTLSEQSPYFIASVTKLFTTTAILQLRAAGKLDLNNRISDYLDGATLEGLHIYRGKDYTHALTIRQLLAHTSGLPDYFQGKDATGNSIEATILGGKDRAWAPEEAIAWSKSMTPLFAPGTKGKAHYSDTNYQLLGRIIEHVSGSSYAEYCHHQITVPLGLANTYLYQELSDNTPQQIYHKQKVLAIPKAMASFGPDGGVVSTSAELLRFTEAFFTGRLFPLPYLKELQRWQRIFFPLWSGIGIQRLKLPWLLNPLGSVPEFIGHTGQSGVVAFYSPQKKIFAAGTVNQTAHPSLAIKTMIKLTQNLPPL